MTRARLLPYRAPVVAVRSKVFSGLPRGGDLLFSWRAPALCRGVATGGNPYDILNVSRGASAKEIRLAYLKAAKKHHPDLNKGDPDAKRRFQQVANAYSALSETGPAAGNSARDHAGHSSHSAGPDPDELFRSIYRKFGFELVEEYLNDVRRDAGRVTEDVARGDYKTLKDFAWKHRALILPIVVPTFLVIRFPGALPAIARGMASIGLEFATIRTIGLGISILMYARLMRTWPFIVLQVTVTLLILRGILQYLQDLSRRLQKRREAAAEAAEKATKEKAEIRERSKLWEMSDAEKAEIREKSKLRQRQDSPIKEISSDINVLSSDAREKKSLLFCIGHDVVHLSFQFSSSMAQHYCHPPRMLVQKRMFSHFQSDISSGAFWLCFRELDSSCAFPAFPTSKFSFRYLIVSIKVETLRFEAISGLFANSNYYSINFDISHSFCTRTFRIVRLAAILAHLAHPLGALNTAVRVRSHANCFLFG